MKVDVVKWSGKSKPSPILSLGATKLGVEVIQRTFDLSLSLLLEEIHVEVNFFVS